MSNYKYDGIMKRPTWKDFEERERCEKNRKNGDEGIQPVEKLTKEVKAGHYKAIGCSEEWEADRVRKIREGVLGKV